MNTSSDRFKGGLALLAAAFLYAGGGVLIREMAKMFSDSAQIFGRLAIAALLIITLNIVRHKSLHLPKFERAGAILLGVSFSVNVLFFTLAIIHTELANAIVLLYAGSLTTSVLIGTLLFRESLTLIKLLALVLAIVGLVLYAGDTVALSSGIIFGFLAGVTDGIVNSIRKKIGNLDRSVLMSYQYGIAGLITLPWLLFVPGQAVHGFNALSVAALVAFGVLLLIIGSVLLYGFKHFDLNVGTILLITEVIFAAGFGLLFYHEVPSAQELVSGGFIIAASILSVLSVDTFRSILRSRKATA